MRRLETYEYAAAVLRLDFVYMVMLRVGRDSKSEFTRRSGSDIIGEPGEKSEVAGDGAGDCEVVYCGVIC